MKLRYLVLSVIVLSIYSCTKLNEEDIVFDAERQKLCDLDTIHFTEHIKPILSSNCLSCHSNAQAQGGITLEDYADVSFLALDGILIDVIKHNPGAKQMPNNGAMLHECYISAIEKWAAQGALNN